jgi:hypothetical protein
MRSPTIATAGLALLVACSAPEKKRPTLTGSEFASLAKSGQDGVLVGEMRCRRRNSELPGDYFWVGVGRLSDSLVALLRRRPDLQSRPIWKIVEQLPIDTGWVNQEPADGAVPKLDPYDGEYWRVVTFTDPDQARGFVLGYVECLNSLGLAEESLAPTSIRTMQDILSRAYGIDSTTQEIDESMESVPIGVILDSLIARRRP